MFTRLMFVAVVVTISHGARRLFTFNGLSDENGPDGGAFGEQLKFIDKVTKPPIPLNIQYFDTSYTSINVRHLLYTCF